MDKRETVNNLVPLLSLPEMNAETVAGIVRTTAEISGFLTPDEENYVQC
jgi:hypothetical protein